MLPKSLRALFLGLALATSVGAKGLDQNVHDIKQVGSRQAQNIVTWDDHSLFINGERLMVFSGEFHPFRLPVQSLWLDILQKIKASGYNCVSIYINWHLIEAERGQVRMDGIFDLNPFFEAAKKAGLYVLPRPGPYINAEVAGGGFPGWLTRTPGALRTYNEAFFNATDLYTHEIGKVIAAHQITNGGPVILFQPENEYQNTIDQDLYPMPDFDYWERVQNQYRDAGVIVPYVNNEAHMNGYITAHTPASVDIYGHDSYPLGFDCENPTVWPEDGLPTDWLAINNAVAPDTPYTIPEYQGGGFQHWGDAGFENCALLLNMEFERVLYKNNYAVGATIFNIYMTYGGTNWGNLGHAEGFTSYDYGAQITEERLLWREKYSEVKLQANFFHVSPAFLAAERFNSSLDFTDNPGATVTPARTNTTKFYISRHTQYDTVDRVPYKLTVETVGHGDLVILQLGDSLYLTRRDSKIHVSDYPVGDHTLIYSSAEVFTWKKYDDKTVLVLYGGPDEHHEIAIGGAGSADSEVLEGSGVKIEDGDNHTIVAWDVTTDRKLVRVHRDLYIYLVVRNEAYNFWVPPTGSGGDYGTSDVIVKAGYLVRTVNIDASTLALVGDVNATTPIEIIGGAPADLKTLTWNGQELSFEQSSHGVITATVDFSPPEIKLPCFSQLKWKTIDSLPEIQSSYDDSLWTDADLTTSPNDKFPIKTPVSLYASDYGFHTGSVIYRGHFTATTAKSTLNITLQGGHAFGASIWLDDQHLGSWPGSASAPSGTLTMALPSLKPDTSHVFTVLIDLMGLNGNYVLGEDNLKTPRGILAYSLSGHEPDAIKWKLTGNLGGERYADKKRGPLNEGALFAERQGYHQPSPPSSSWAAGGPTSGRAAPGVSFYTAEFALDLPRGYDVPLAVRFGMSEEGKGAYRVQLFVNGFQFGKFVPHIGPQARFPVPEGILDYHGTNTVGITLWAMEEGGARVEGMAWDVAMVTASGFGDVELTEAPVWEEREGAY
ncbi:beta-galactosidase A like protein [Verticillium longisporum]|uniref:beta-galactosidase n=1 Tax=Verticillium longisporum TaxID=100787 RepID=A0A8I2ZN49_VERLO|nr:beta-galactosidase A like protein [Verticillium longisporum]